MTTPTDAGLPDVDPITDPDDPRLEGWYHTIDLAPGVVTKGVYDLRRLVGGVGIPDDLTGCTALDIGTANGFWAFEMERRGASHVVAVDVASHHDWDWLPHLRPSDEPDPIVDMRERFALAHAMRGSEVDYKSVNVYDLSPETVGVFDVVYCGSLLLHLQAPLYALSAIRSVTREMAIIEFCVDDTLESLVPELPCVRIGPTVNTGEPGIEASYSWFNTAGIVQMLEFAGFTDCDPMPPQRLFPYDIVIRTVRARPRPLEVHSIAVTNPAVFAERFPAPTHAVPDPSEEPPSARELRGAHQGPHAPSAVRSRDRSAPRRHWGRRRGLGCSTCAAPPSGGDATRARGAKRAPRRARGVRGSYSARACSTRRARRRAGVICRTCSQ